MIGHRFKSLWPMKIKVKDLWDEFSRRDVYDPSHGCFEHSTRAVGENWREMDVDTDELVRLAGKGYGIRINC